MPQCISPVTLKQEGVLNSFPCGKCNFCLQNRRNDWTFRILQELRRAKTAHFLTLTYDEQNQPWERSPFDSQDKIATLDKRDVQLFKKRLRKDNDAEPIPANLFDPENEEWPSIKYYTVGEYGTETFRPHYHSIIFNIKPSVINRLEKLWGKGYVVVGSVEPPSVHYVTKYVLNKNDKSHWEPIAPPFSLISKGMGGNYLDSNAKQHKKSRKTFVVGDRGKQRLPRYYRDKIFNEHERAQLAQSAQEQNDLLYRETINRLQNYHPSPETYHEYCERLRHERIQTAKKSKPHQL